MRAPASRYTKEEKRDSSGSIRRLLAFALCTRKRKEKKRLSSVVNSAESEAIVLITLSRLDPVSLHLQFALGRSKQSGLEVGSNPVARKCRRRKIRLLFETTGRMFESSMEPDPVSVTENGRREQMSMDDIAALLAVARQRINEGNPSLALQAVVTALRASGGERAVLQAFNRAREQYQSHRQTNSAVDELSALFADCGLTDIQSLNTGTNGDLPIANGHQGPSAAQEMAMMDGNVCRFNNSAPILAESGRLQVVVDASADGSSFVCGNCGGVVSIMRRDEHFQFWCTYGTQGC